MNAPSAFGCVRLGCTVALLAATTLAGAQGTAPSIRAAPQPAAPTPAPGSVGSGLPNPAGLTSQFPAGLPPPVLPGLPGSMVPNVSAPGAAPGSPPIDAGVAQPGSTMGAAGAYAAGAGRAAGMVAGGPYTPVQVAQSFINADLNRDGELTRAEAQRLSIAPYSFEEMDSNHDGILSRFEYEAALR